MRVFLAAQKYIKITSLATESHGFFKTVFRLYRNRHLKQNFKTKSKNETVQHLDHDPDTVYLNLGTRTNRINAGTYLYRF